MPVVTNWGDAIITSLANALNLVLSFIPKLIGFLIILLIGWIVATAISKAVTFLLRKVGFDRIGNRIGLNRLEQRMGINMDAAGLLGKIVYWFIFLIFLVPAVNALELTAVSNILNQLIAYIPDVFVAIIVLFLGAFAATLVADVVRGAAASANLGSPNLFANIARYAVIGFAALIALEQLQIAPSLINILFTAIVGAAAIALGLAFGLGGQDAARRWLAKGESTATSAASQLQAKQAQAQSQQGYVEQSRQAQMQGDPMQVAPDYPTQPPRNRPPTR